MRKRVVLICILLCIICGFSFFIVNIATGLYKQEGSAYSFYMDENITDEYIQYTIQEGLFEICDELDGYVVYGENAMVTVSQNNANDKVEINCKIGQKVKKNEVVCSDTYKSTKSPVNGRIVSIEDGETVVITIVNYSDTKIRISVPEKYQNYVDYSTEIYGMYNNSKNKLLKVYAITPSVEEGYFDVYLNNKFKAYENSKINISVKYAEKEKVVSIPKEYVKSDAEGQKYITILNQDETTSKKAITIGSEGSGRYEVVDGNELINKIAVVSKKELMVEDSEK